jgi:hypothetical protein
VIAVWVVAPFSSTPEDSVEFGSMKHAQHIVTTFTQLFLMCYYALIKNPEFSASILTQRVERYLVSEISKCYSFSILRVFQISTFIGICTVSPFIRHAFDISFLLVSLFPNPEPHSLLFSTASCPVLLIIASLVFLSP